MTESHLAWHQVFDCALSEIDGGMTETVFSCAFCASRIKRAKTLTVLMRAKKCEGIEVLIFGVLIKTRGLKNNNN